MTRRTFSALTMAAWFSLIAGQTVAQTGLPTAPPTSLPQGPAAVDSDAQPTLDDDKATIVAGEKWLALLDTGKFGAAWDVSSAHLKSVVTRQKWVTEIGKARKPFGKLTTRKAERFARAHSLPDAPEGDYSIVEFESKYANGSVRPSGSSGCSTRTAKPGASRAISFVSGNTACSPQCSLPIHAPRSIARSPNIRPTASSPRSCRRWRSRRPSTGGSPPM
jgi:hypothetical protein